MGPVRSKQQMQSLRAEIARRVDYLATRHRRRELAAELCDRYELQQDVLLRVIEDQLGVPSGPSPEAFARQGHETTELPQAIVEDL